ncbi:diguanylate cyclase [Ideonella sp. A 288]|uniref:GGDEF domain-containing protein n=1 Tax=Ideonella sp. A 288 TaxID=1962181 RepID=UPI0013039717|nr:GGDEF domain-containing protein [Ideonella sp. A 288]
MDLLSRARRALNVDNDALSAHRARIRRNFSILGAMAFLPLAVLHLVNANWLMFAVNTAVGGTMLANGWALQRGRNPVVPFLALGCIMVVGVCLSAWRQGIYGVLWANPALFMFFFVLSRRWALALGAALLLGVTAASSLSLGWPLAARVFMSLGFTLIMINVALNVVSDLQQALESQASTDPLTGAFNRRHLQMHLAQRVAPADAAAPGDALLAIDIDHFKLINDRHGHDVGDQVLCRLVAAVGARKRGSDLLFRTGGEEFVLLLPRVTLADAQRLAEDLRQRLEQAELLPGETVTVSIGVSALAPGQSAEAWFKSADAALYDAKHLGRNCVVVAGLDHPRASEALHAGSHSPSAGGRPAA